MSTEYVRNIKILFTIPNDYPAIVTARDQKTPFVGWTGELDIINSVFVALQSHGTAAIFYVP